MTKTEQSRIESLTKDLKERYGPLMCRDNIREALHFQNISSVGVWAGTHGVRSITRGLYAADDIARAVVLGCA